MPLTRDEDIAELWQDIRDAAVLALPGWAIQMYGYAEPPPLIRKITSACGG